MKPVEKSMFNQPSWGISTESVELYLTVKGGHMAPVTFFRNTKTPVEPYFINPWHNEKNPTDIDILNVLRGDFFCCPFGGGAYKKEVHPIHGETANGNWTLEAAAEKDGIASLTVSMKTKIRPGKVEKKLLLKKGHNAVYLCHTLSGYTGPMAPGHHATLKVPDREGAMLISTSPIHYGLTNGRSIPETFSGDKEYYSLASGKKFTSLAKVPTLWKDMPYTDCSVYPNRKGFVDILGVFAKTGKTPAWTAAVLPAEGYLWFSLKDPVKLPTTLMWRENRGRHGAPWSSRTLCLGLEDICAFMAEGLGGSAKPNVLNKAGIATSVTLSKAKPYSINYIQGAALVPKGFDRVKSASFGRGEVVFTSESGKKVKVPVSWDFVYSGSLA